MCKAEMIDDAKCESILLTIDKSEDLVITTDCFSAFLIPHHQTGSTHMGDKVFP